MENVYLLGSEGVEKAGHNISAAASDMIRAANIIDQSVFNFQEQINRLELLLQKAIDELPQGG